MPASGGDPVTVALRLSLTASQDLEDNTSLEKRLAASTARVLLTHIDYEPHGNCFSNVLSDLKSKYIVLRNPDTFKNGADAASSTSKMPVSNIGSNCNGNMKPEPDSILPSPKVTLFPAERVQLGWKGTHCVGAGMINVGNTCYLNSTLQALFHVPAFVNWLHSDNNHLSNCTGANGTINGECIICAMNKTLKASQSKSGTVIKPFLIYNKLKFICKHLVHGQQEDAHEFMRYLLESMEKAFLTRYKGNKLDNYSKETTPLNQIFGGYIRTEVTCLTCGGVSTTFQHCQDLLLDIRRASTLDDALAAYFCKERLDGDDAYRCEQCHRKVSATKKFSIEKPPQVLCIQFKRFSILGGKINKHVSFTQKLDLTRFLCSQSAHCGPVPLTYRLVSMVTHVGSSVHCGHYTAVAQSSTGQFYQFDDSSVRPISLSSVMNTNAYIMMYEREPRVQCKGPSSPQQSVASATATTGGTYAVNGQKSSLVIRNQPIQGPTTIPIKHKMGPVINHKIMPNNLNNYKQNTESNFSGNGTTYSTPSPLLPAKERDRVVFGLHQPAASPATPRLVMHIKNGKVNRPPPQPSPQQQEPSASTAASSSASLVPYCESGEDESSSSGSEESPPCLWDMPSLAEVDSSSPNTMNVNGKVQSKINSKRNFGCNTGIPGSAESGPTVAAGSSEHIATSCSAVGESVQIKTSDVNRINSVKYLLDLCDIEKDRNIPLQNSSDFESGDKLLINNLHNKDDPVPPQVNPSDNSKLKRSNVAFPCRSQNIPAPPIKSNAESVESWRADSISENCRNKITTAVRSTAPKIRHGMDMASSKEVNLQVNTSVCAVRGKLSSGWQVTDLLLHSPSVTSESSASSNSGANSTTDWAVSEVKQRHFSRKIKKYPELVANAHNLLPVSGDLKTKSPVLKTESDSQLSESKVVNSVDVEDGSRKFELKSVESKKTDVSCEDAETCQPKSKHARDSDIEHDRKREKKLKKLKKRKKRDKLTENGNGSGDVEEGDEEKCYVWVEKTHETLGLNSSYKTETNGHFWDGSRKSDVMNHLSNLSHRGYGTNNVTTWSGERSHMEEEVERDRKDDRKRSYDNAYNEEFDRGKVKKMKYYQTDVNHNKVKYNAFQDYHNYKNSWQSTNGSSYYHKPYYHNGNKGHYYSNHNARHKQYAGRSNGYHNGDKYRKRFNKRDHWRH